MAHAWRIPVFITCAALIVRAAVWWIDPFGAPAEDARQYHTIGANLAERGIYATDDEPPYRPTGRRMPAYPAFLAAIYTVTGPDYRAAELVQVLLGGLICLGVAAAGSRIFGSRPVGVAAAGLAVVSPPLVQSSVDLMTELAFTGVLLGTVWSAARWAGTRKSGWGLLTGGLCGLLTLIKPEAALLPAFLFPAVFLIAPSSWRVRDVLIQGAAASLVVGLLVAPWVLRNYLVFGQAGLQVDSGQDEGDADGSGLLRGYRLRAEHGLLLRPERHAYLYGDDLDAAQARYNAVMASEPADPSESDLRYFLRRPVTFAKFCAVRLFQLLQPASWDETFGLETEEAERWLPNWARKASKAALLLFDGVVLLFGFVGFARSFRPAHRRLWVVTATIAYFLLIYALLHGLLRYRIPLYPLLLLLGVWWLMSIGGRRWGEAVAKLSSTERRV